MKVNKESVYLVLLMVCLILLGIFLNSIFACRLCVFILLIICISRGIKEKYIINPYLLFTITPFSLLIYSNVSSNYTLDLTASTWMLAIINIISFIIGLEFTPNYKSTQNCVGVGEGKILIQNNLIMMILGCIPSIYTVALGETMPLASVFSLFSTVALVTAIMSRKKWLLVIVIISYTFSWFGYVSKTSVLMLLIAVLVGYEKYHVKTIKNKKQIILFLVAAIIIMLFAFSFANQGRENAKGASAVEYYSKYGGVTWNRNANLFMPYMYLITPWSNLQYVSETQNLRTYGLWFVKPFLGYAQLDDIFKQSYKLNAYSSFNTFTYISVQFKDFGFWGSCIISAFLGSYVKKYYSRYILSKSPLDAGCYALIAMAVLNMFFSNHFFMQSYPFTIVIIVWVYKKIFCKFNNVELEKC